MTGKVIKFEPRSARKPHTNKQPPTVFEKSNFEIFQDVQDDVLGAWKSAVVRDGINLLIHDKLPATARQYLLKTRNCADYMNDLSALARVEKKLKMRVAIFSPGCTVTNPVGWLAAFHLGKETFTTPSDMALEEYARAMNIVLFVEFEKTLKSLGRTVGESR